MKKTVYLLLAASLLFSCGREKKKKEITFESTRTYKKGEPDKTISGNVSKGNFNFLPSNTGKIVKHDYYSLSYVEDHEQAEWVAYELKKRYTKGKAKRQDDFRIDEDVMTGSATLDDYRKSGYDRGHLLPAADMKFSKEAMSQTFFMSNMSPQNPQLNRGRWKELEEQIRDWVQEDKHYYIITGPILSTVTKKTIGTNQVSIPSEYYKIILDYTEPDVKMIGFIMPNEKCPKDLFSYQVSVDKIEEKTGLDFFADLPDKIENKLEASEDITLWKE